MIEIRRGTADECTNALYVLQTAFAQYHWLQPPSGVTRETVASLQEKLATHTLLLAVDDGRIVGCLFFTPMADQPGDLYFGRLAVLPAYHKRAIARRLIGEVERYAAEQGYRRVILGVRIALTDNLRLFHSLGYEIYAENTHGGSPVPTYYSMSKLIPSYSAG